MRNTQRSRQILWWSLFDFANSIVIVNLVLYFPQWLVVEKGVSAFWYNFVDVVVTVLLLSTLPVLGVISDIVRKKVLFLKLTAIPIAVFTFSIGFFGQTLTGFPPVIIGFFSFLLIIYFYQLSLIFYNAMLGNLAERKRYGTISGIGLAAGWAGGIVGLLIVLPFVSGNIPFFQPAGRLQAFIPSALIFGVVAGISLTFLKEPEGINHSNRNERVSIKQAYKKVWEDFKGVKKVPTILYFLIAYWLFIDGILTFQDNFSLYLEIVLKIPDQQKVLLGVLVLITLAVGAILIGRLADKFGYKKLLIAMVGSWIIALVAFLQVSSFLSLAIVVCVIGLVGGGTWTVARALYTAIIPATKRGEYFGFYGSAERFASVLGPLIWSASVVGLRTYGPLRYKAAVVSMMLLIAISLIFLKKMQLRRVNKM